VLVEKQLRERGEIHLHMYVYIYLSIDTNIYILLHINKLYIHIIPTCCGGSDACWYRSNSESVVSSATTIAVAASADLKKRGRGWAKG